MLASQTGSQQRSAAAIVCTCPFCGLLCDDVGVSASDGGTVSVSARGCELSRAGFARQSATGQDSARVGGSAATFEQAVEAAAKILREAVQPLIGGLATDVAGMRAAVELADRCGAVLDHAASTAKFRNLLAFQDRGAITTTLAEVRNRADLLVVVGTDVISRFPRFFERIAAPGGTLFGLKDKDRRSIFLGARPPPDAPGRTDWIACGQPELPDVLGALQRLDQATPLAGGMLVEVLIDGLDLCLGLCLVSRIGSRPAVLEFPLHIEIEGNPGEACGWMHGTPVRCRSSGCASCRTRCRRPATACSSGPQPT